VWLKKREILNLFFFVTEGRSRFNFLKNKIVLKGLNKKKWLLKTFVVYVIVIYLRAFLRNNVDKVFFLAENLQKKITYYILAN